MSIRIKLFIFILAFIAVTAMFGLGSGYLFHRITEHIDPLRRTADEHELQENFEKSIRQFTTITKNWAFTSERQYSNLRNDTFQQVLKDYNALHDFIKDEESFSRVHDAFEELQGVVAKIFAFDDPIGKPEILRLIRRLDESELRVFNEIEELHDASVDNIGMTVRKADKLRESLKGYFAIILFFTVTFVFFLIMLITRSIGKPFKELINFTEGISSGDTYDITGKMRSDEFGIIARRFSDVLKRLKESEKKLKKRLIETELLLDVSRIASSTPELRESLIMTSETVAERMNFDYVGIYLFNSETMRFHLQATNRNHDVFAQSFPLGKDGMIAKMFSSLEGVFAERLQKDKAAFVKSDIGSVRLFTIVKEGRCHGALVLGSREEGKYAADEMHIGSILSNTISTIMKNAELYTSTINQLNKITLLYELSKELTTVLDLDEILRKVTSEMARLLSANGCIIRLRENGRLRIRSYYGVPDDLTREMEVAIGEGIAGKVAESGKPLLVEDVSLMPEDTRVPLLNVKSVVCVPLRIGEDVIGTVGLYDKQNQDGVIVSFGYDDLTATEGFGSIIALAIEKARFFEKQVLKEKEALESKKRLDLLFESVHGGIVTIDRNYTILSINKFIEDLLNLNSEDVLGKSAISVFHDEGGICPHCVAKLTFETGGINFITQSKGANYAELSCYPVMDEEGTVYEAVVLIQDITDRVLYQEEIITLYREVAQTKEFLESIIDNSADAIVASDINGIVTSWNRGAERIYGFMEREALGNFLPFIPDFLIEPEREYIERIKEGETIKNIETLRERKDGTMIEVSLTLSPIKDATGEIIGISGISRDICEKKKVEKELIRRNQELSRLFFISSAMRSTLELDKLLRMVLTAVTMSDGLGFNRAILFLHDEEMKAMRGVMGVGPSSSSEAWDIWNTLSLEKKTLPEIMSEIEDGPLRKDSFLDRLSTGLEVDIEGDTALPTAIKEKKSFNIKNAKINPLADPIIIQQLGSEAYALVPLVARDKVIGILWVDNYFNRKIISAEDMHFLEGFSDQVASAIESARLFEQVRIAEQELENIFESISDLVYITTEDYTIRKINMAVEKKVGLPQEAIVGRKCYEIFHGMDKPYEKCPHHKTVETYDAYVEEFEDYYGGGTTLSSTSPLFDSTGNFLGTVHIVRDISEMKKLREKLALSERMAALGEVAAKVAHEIRNPLVSIGGFSRRLEKRLDGQFRDYAAIITREVRRLEGILKDILDFVKEVRLSRETVELSVIMNEIVSLYAREIDRKGILLKQDYADPLHLEVDPDRIKEAIINIISNAIQVLDRGDRLSIKTLKKEDYGVIEITDTGPGIREEDFPFIFDPFFTTKLEGTGLGLAIAHRIVEEHGGKIEAFNNVGGGSKFLVYLPYKIMTGGGDT
jgi:PAS domain S-box-containing protein